MGGEEILSGVLLLFIKFLNMGQFITAGLIGSLLTIIIQAIVNAISDKTKYKRELRKQVFMHKLEVVENAMSWYQEALDTYYLLQTSLREYDKNCNQVTFQKLYTACSKSASLFQETSSRLNSLYLYYDFSDIEKKYYGRESLDCMNELITKVAKITDYISNNTPSEFLGNSYSELETERIDAVHKLADAIDNQVYIITEIGQRLRNEYKGYLD